MAGAWHVLSHSGSLTARKEPGRKENPAYWLAVGGGVWSPRHLNVLGWR